MKKRNRSRSVLACLLTLFMLWSLAPAAFATGEPEEDYVYIRSGESVTINDDVASEENWEPVISVTDYVNEWEPKDNKPASLTVNGDVSQTVTESDRYANGVEVRAYGDGAEAEAVLNGDVDIVGSEYAGGTSVSGYDGGEAELSVSGDVSANSSQNSNGASAQSSENGEAALVIAGDVTVTGDSDVSGVSGSSGSGGRTAVKVEGNVAATSTGDGADSDGWYRMPSTVAVSASEYNGGQTDVAIGGDVDAAGGHGNWCAFKCISK